VDVGTISAKHTQNGTNVGEESDSSSKFIYGVSLQSVGHDIISLKGNTTEVSHDK